MPLDFGALTVVEDDEVAERIDDAATQYPYADQVYEALKWRLARDPYCGDSLTGTNANPPRRVLKIPPHSIAHSPGLLARYYIGKDSAKNDVVVIDWIEILPYSDEDAVAPKAYSV